MFRHVAAAFFVVFVFATSGSAHAGYFPAQFSAKLYTEALGRIPDQGGWQGQSNYFTQAGCSSATLSVRGQDIFTSSEFLALPYDNTSRLLALYRGALNREPDTASFNSNLHLLNTGTTWSSMVSSFVGSSEFQSLATTICNGAPPSYGFGSAPVIAVATIGTGFAGGTGASLQMQLNTAPSGGTVWLAERSVVSISATLVIPPGVRLATTGNPSTNAYANMGRLVRQSNFSGPIVQLKAGAKLQNVWVTGQRSILGFASDSINVETDSGTNTTVSNNRIENPAGSTNLKVWNSIPGFPACVTNYIGYNLITGYATNHYPLSSTVGGWADGITMPCESATIEQNQIVDATDVAIVMFWSAPVNQGSIVRNNQILSAGNSAYAALGFDPWMNGTGLIGFNGATFSGNTLWTGPSTHFDFALAVGTRPWFGAASNKGTGGTMTGNTSGTQSARVNDGIAVSGMLNATVQSNTIVFNVVSVAACPTETIAAGLSAGWASGSIQGPVTDIDITGCIGHPVCHTCS